MAFAFFKRNSKPKNRERLARLLDFGRVNFSPSIISGRSTRRTRALLSPFPESQPHCITYEWTLCTASFLARLLCAEKPLCKPRNGGTANRTGARYYSPTNTMPCFSSNCMDIYRSPPATAAQSKNSVELPRKLALSPLPRTPILTQVIMDDLNQQNLSLSCSSGNHKWPSILLPSEFSNSGSMQY